MRRRSVRKMTVEECIAFDLSGLVRAGVFRAPPGTPCNSIWEDSDQKEILRIYFWRDLTPTGRSFLRIVDRVFRASKFSRRVGAQNFEIVQAPVHFGFRHWFRCPGLVNGTSCGRNVRFLYLPPNETRFCCRKCHDLVHLSAQRHDKRVDALAKLPVRELQLALTNGNLRQRLLAVQACSVVLRRLRRKVRKWSRYEINPLC